MDYYHNTSATDTKSTHPNQHDYDELAAIYNHLDNSTTIGLGAEAMPAAANGDLSAPNEWGKLVSTSAHGEESTFVRDFGNGNLVVTHIIWAK